MKKLATVIAIALIGTPALAADMAVKAPPPAPAPVYNWTGWYAGVNAGASFGNVKTDFNVAPVAVVGSLSGGVTGTGHITVPGFAGSDREYPSGFIGVARSATIGNSLPYGSWDLRPTYKVPSKKKVILPPVISVKCSSFR